MSAVQLQKAQHTVVLGRLDAITGTVGREVVVVVLRTEQELTELAVQAGVLAPTGDGGVRVDNLGNPHYRRLIGKLGLEDAATPTDSGGPSILTAEVLHAAKLSLPTPAGLIAAHGLADGRVSLTTTHPHFVVHVSETIALERVRQKYVEIGEGQSPIGLPWHDTGITVVAIADGWRAAFRSGAIVAEDDGGMRVEPWEWVRLVWVGIECSVRQESEDEVFGTVWLMAQDRNPGAAIVVKFPDTDVYVMGAPGTRLIPQYVPMYEGPLVNLNVGATLIEHDSGDIGHVKQALAQAIQQGATAAGTAATGAPVGVVTDQPWFRDLIDAAIGGIASEIFGTGDDPYNPGSFTIEWNTMKDSFQSPQSYSRNDGPQSIPNYTHRFTLTGSDGSDTGQYTFYFLVESAPNPG